jgi:hypothetical protein
MKVIKEYSYGILFAALASIAVLVLMFGRKGYQQILEQNQCKMTYSYPFQYNVKHEWKGTERYQLLQLTDIENGVSSLNPHPVLFIPGHQGRLAFSLGSLLLFFHYVYSHQQIRSFASDKHNSDNFFQYFAIDFNNDFLGIHGSDIMKKSAFVNEALLVIRKLYSNKNSSKSMFLLL